MMRELRRRPSDADDRVELVDYRDEDEDEERGASPVFSSMRDYAAEVDAIDAAASKHIEAILSELPASPGGASSSLDAFLATEFDDDRIDTSRREAGERAVPGFASHQPEFKQQIVSKKLRLLEKQIERRDKQIARLAIASKQANATIDKLQRDLKAAQEELETAQQEWEEERESILRFRGTGGSGNNNQGFSVPIVLGNAKRIGNDAEAQRQRELKLQMMMKGAAEAREMLEDTDGLSADMGGGAGASGLSLMLKKARFFIRRRLDPYASDIRQIEARFGYSVASYFRFLVWIIKTFMVLASTGIVFLSLHIYYQVQMQQFTGISVNWIAFSGIIPTILAFPGYHSGEALMYTAALLILEALLLLFTLHKWIVEDRRAKAIEAVERATQQPRYGKIVLNAWDFSLTSAEQASDLRKSISEQLKVTMEEERLSEKLKQRTKKEWYALYVRRVIVATLYFALQASSWYVIVILTTQSSQLQLVLSLKAPVLAPYSSSIVPAAVTVINSLLPAIISLLTSLEKWDDVGFAIKIMVTRLYLAKVLNVLIQLFSFALLLDPYLLTSTQTFMDSVTINGATIRTNVMVEFKPSYSCRGGQVAAGLLTLVVTDFAVSKAMAIVSPFVGLALKIVKSVVHYWNTKRIERKKAKKKAQAVVIPAPDQDESAAASTEHRSPTPVPIEEENSENNPKLDAPKVEDTPQLLPTTEEVSASKTTDQEKPKLSGRGTRFRALRDILPKSEFQVPQKMVAMLYSCTIALVAVPLAPPVIIAALLIHTINFKFDKFILMRFQKKPTNPWSAKDAGSFFVKFYFCTALIFVIFAHYVLLNKNLAKQCDLQDSAMLCASNTYDAASEICELSPSAASAEYFRTSDECKNEYPRCVCTYQCGPFTGVASGITPFLAVVSSINVVASLYSLVIDNKTVAWGMLLTLALALLLMRNSLRVLVMVTLQRENEVAWTLTSLRKKIKQLENRLRIHKVTEGKETV